MNQNDMPVFCDVSAEEQVNVLFWYSYKWISVNELIISGDFVIQIEALQAYFRSKQAKLVVSSSENIVENLNDLIKNLDCLYSSDPQEAGY